MFKIVYENIIIDLVKELKYARFLPKSGHTPMTDITSANCIIASNNKDKYHLKGMPYPEGSGFRTVSAIKISDTEYEQLSAQLKLQNSTAINNGLHLMRQKKIKEMSEACHQSIIGGLRILLSDNKMHHFELSVEDQVNLLEIKYLMDGGQTSFTYHETDGLCKEYSLKDMQTIIKKSFEHKQKALNYFNSLKHYISTLMSINDILAVEYGMEIPQ